MKLQFIVDKTQLISATIKNYNAYQRIPFPAWKRLEKRLWSKYKNDPAYYFVNPYIKASHTVWALEDLSRQSALNGIPFKNVLSDALKKVDSIYQEIEESDEFKRLHKETSNYLLLTKKRWNAKEVEIFQFITKVAGITLPAKTVKVFINHPKTGGGQAYSENNALRWGHSEDWPNYTVVYLAHELMHILTKKQQKTDKTMHSLIELMTDNELRIRLNGEGDYLTIDGHAYIKELVQKILPIWQDYLAGKLKAKNIFELEKYIIKKGIA
ncbi:hypothetical protein A2524_02065 [Candidatus Wolfebacteria bacterium RIFOXYD12_FULL_48_21]|nr:MAG: hypothetical protein A2524_02065 [Candidatus Wolfebacteria bacterium RIFOXYD12_FULL_48_21]OGM95683.1 MAG: hypothetical protein A2532_02875 [Candidatus Wolfebacteria bacterium RIFOXYD2_FULL_48_11]